MGHTARREIFQFQLSPKNFFNHGNARQDVLRRFSDTGKRTLLSKCRKLRPQGQGSRAGAWSIMTREIAVSKFMELDFDLRPAVCIGSECGHEFLMDLFRALVLHPERFNEKSLFLCLHLLPIMCFINLINSEPFLLFHN
jgi:hypothetical protein